jgi:glycosyltransferase involved in cell wall biosynthesis
MISVTVIAKNSQATLSRCLNSVKNIADDLVVVVDPATGDDTARIAKELGARVFYRPFDDFSSQKSYCLSKTRHDWVLSLDADEWISHQLAGQIVTAISSEKYAAYKIPRLNIIFGRPINYSNWSPRDDTHIWLFKKSASTWQGQVHEEIAVRGPVGELTGLKYHLNYTSVDQFITRLNLYTSREAESSRMYVHPLTDFFRRFIWHQGFRDGWHGFFLSYLMLIYHLSAWVKSKNITTS